MHSKALGIGALALLFGADLSAAPDPDLFDGRVAGQASAASGSAASGSAAEPGGQSADAASASAPDRVGEGAPATPQSGAGGRDLSEVGQIGSGASLPPGEPGEPDAAAGSAGGSAAPPDQSLSGGGISGGGTSGGGTSGGENGEQVRDFSQIGSIGSGRASETIEVNSSKASGPAGASSPLPEEAAPGGSSPASTPSTEVSSPGSGIGGSGSEPRKGRSTGDFGETLPSGI